MSLIDILIPLVPGIVLIAFPQLLTPKTASAEEAAGKKSKLRKIGYVLAAVAVVFCLLKFAQPR